MTKTPIFIKTHILLTWLQKRPGNNVAATSEWNVMEPFAVQRFQNVRRRLQESQPWHYVLKTFADGCRRRNPNITSWKRYCNVWCLLGKLIFFSNDHENATLYRRCSHVREITLFNQLHTNVDITLRSNVVFTLSRPLKCNVIPRRCNNIETMLCLPYVIKYKQYLNVYIARALYISFLGYIYFFQLNNCS